MKRTTAILIHRAAVIASETDFPEPDEMPAAPTMDEWSDDLQLVSGPDHHAEFPPYDGDPPAGEPVDRLADDDYPYPSRGDDRKIVKR